MLSGSSGMLSETDKNALMVFFAAASWVNGATTTKDLELILKSGGKFMDTETSYLSTCHNVLWVIFPRVCARLQ